MSKSSCRWIRFGTKNRRSSRTTTCWRRAGSTSSGRSATTPGASTVSSGAVPAVRAIPGASQFFLSLEDDLMRLFMTERVADVMEKWGVQEGEVITHGLVTKSIGQAQKRVEGNNFEARKRLLDYDDVMNQQREVIYDLRLFALEGGEDLKGEIWEMIEHSVRDMVEEYCDPELPAGRVGSGRTSAPAAPGLLRHGLRAFPRRTRRKRIRRC